jgi:transposase
MSWIVERTNSWFNGFRGILIRWCKKAENYLGMLQFACGIITWRAVLLLFLKEEVFMGHFSFV